MIRAFLGLSLLLLAMPALAEETRIEWSRSPSSGVVGYLVERLEPSGWTAVANVPQGAPEQRLEWTGAPGQYRVRAVSASGNVSEPAIPRLGCAWAVGACRVPVSCERECLCDAVVARLEEINV
jgi:hypothetical protein